MIRKMFQIVGSIAFVYILLCVMMYVMQRSMMYITSPQKPSLTESGVKGMEEISVTTEDGLELFGWYKAPFPPEKPTIVWLHGNASNVALTTAQAFAYLKAGYGLLAVEYRGYAGNPGRPSEEGLYKDSRAFIEWLKSRGTKENNIILYGESIGSGPALQMAMEYPALNTIILQSPFTTMIEAVRKHYPYMPNKWLVKDKYDNFSKIDKIKAPLIVVQGTEDFIIPYSHGVKLYEAAPEPKSLITIEGGGHNDMYDQKAADKILSVLTE